MLDSKYRNTEDFKKLLNLFKTKSLLLFHLNICSLQKNLDNFHILLNDYHTSLEQI